MLNRAMIIGNLGKDPDLRFTAGGQAVCNFSVATSENYTDRDGQKQERTEWHSVVVWGKQAETCKKYLGKGRKVYVEGRIQTREWEKDGQKHYRTEIVAQDVRFLDKGRDQGFAPQSQEEAHYDRPPGSGASGIIQDPPGTRGGPYSSWTREQTQRNLGQPRESEPLPQDSDLPF